MSKPSYWRSPDVVRLSVVVPRNDMDEFRLDIPHLQPTVIPEIVASPSPVLVLPGQAGAVPRRDGYHVRLPVQCLNVGSVNVGRHVVFAVWPSGPACEKRVLGVGQVVSR